MTGSGLPRFAELTYSSFDRGDGAGGGWQVKDARGGVTRDEQRFLTGRIPTQFDPPVALAQFPTPDDLAARPARLEYGSAQDGAAAYWHVVEAGVDASGRPGNIFAHVLLDRAPTAAQPPLRPADLIFSPLWMRPFGADQVLATSLLDRPEPPWPAPAGVRAQVLGFLTGGGMWPAVLAALLDAVDAALRGGRRVVLGTDDRVRAGMWISAVNHLMSPGTSRRLFWSTHERAANLPTLWTAGAHLAVVPVAELALIEDPGAVVLIEDDRDSVDLGDASAPHHTRAGSVITARPWSAIAGVALADHPLAEKALGIQDQVSEMIGDRDLGCGWPLAMAVAQLPDELGDATAEAALVLAVEPPGLAAHPELNRVRKSLLASGIGPSTDDAWAALSQAEPGGPAWEHLVGVYVSRAVHDARWLDGPTAPELPPPAVAPRDPDVAASVGAALAGLDSAQAPGVETALHVLRVVDLVARAGYLRVEDDGSWRADARRVVAEVVCPVLFDPFQAPLLVERVGWLDAVTQEAVVRPAVSGRLRALPRAVVGGRLLPVVVQWLYPVPPGTPDLRRLGSGERADHCLLELAAQVTLVMPDPSQLRTAALWAMLDSRTPSAREHVAWLAAGPLFPTADLRYALEMFDVLPLIPALLPVLMRASPDGDLHDLAEAVLASPELRPFENADPEVAAVLAAARLRRSERAWLDTVVDERDTELAAELLDAAETVLVGDPKAVITTGTQMSLVTAYVVDLVHRPDSARNRSRVEKRLTAAPSPRTMRAVARALHRFVCAGVVDPVALVLAAQFSAREARRFPLGSVRLRDLSRLEATTDSGEQRPLLELVVQVLGSNSALDPEVAATARGRAVVQLNRTAVDDREAHRLVGEYERFVAEWWAGVGVAEEQSGGWLKRQRRS